MSADKQKSSDYKTLKPSAKKGGQDRHAPDSLKSLANPQNKSHEKGENSLSLNPQNDDTQSTQNLNNPFLKNTKKEFPSESFDKTLVAEQTTRAEIFAVEDVPHAERQKRRKEEKKTERDRKLLSSDNWLRRNGHTFSYVGLFLFSILVLFRPYELIPSLSFLAATAFYFAVATLLIFIPTQLATEGNLTVMSTEVKALLALTLLAIVTMPIAKSPALAWENFNDTFIKAVLMFIVMVNVVRNRRRLMGLMWLSLSVAFVLSWQAIDMFMRGELLAEGYRVDVKIGGMFGNPNDLSLHLVMMIPLAVCLGIAAKSNLVRLVYWTMAALFVSANFVTYSRGGFLGLIAASAVMVWKLGRKSRLNVSLVSITVGIIVTLLAPGNYGMRILSIVGLAPDEVGSRDQRQELLERSIIVTLRNPWGIGIGNFPIVGVRNLVTHNAYTQVSSELGLLGLVAYMIFMVSPFRKLGAIERTEFAKDEHDWFYYLSIGLQASIVAYMVSSFFVAVAYNWFIYYLIAYAVAFRRIYQIEKGLEEELKPAPLTNMVGWRAAENNG